ncbi:hypothetical protein D7V68_15675 [Acinetobacter cumulans]|uniref:hypothetical protein n=1 Tax=Acinetobacter cumulans TaxID=2136182 RepID=UPI000EA2D361|nr:hypothetical protein [Acinetobacter cumulans]RKG45483.1 hypothetical protein D7V68_15675 [Acinetobacter cumulans]
MKLFLDCEFNGFGGELISMALVDENEKYFYEVLPCMNPTSWVFNNVIPILNKQTIDLKEFKENLFNFLNHYETIHIVADWPEDFSLFLTTLMLQQGVCMTTPKLTMELWQSDTNLTIDSEIPHNALQDAFALKRRYFL